ncbi:TIGR04282 family arsenosugar biosynthesis glycosyltransferase [Campylobacter geochelonis]|uniref:TIGR04282 family arsenosugar biosynthesis glycosyltransferase n=1 Tax=Campylobacter geochelonis TaxID=1780362 RepID=UPI0007709CCA|nr:TIGR04282 family arsenosugar biosynthesis glycosyltransferase [Campylobacter geochelonis]CZE50361.1 Uncharacterized conserved protein [Campylobacter geochelonis]
MRAIIFFTKVPVLRRCKTRLLDFLSPDEALNLQKKLIKENFSVLQSLKFKIFIFHSDDGDVQILKDLTSQNVRFFAQQGVGLGEKMSQAFKEIFALGYDKVLLMGSDIVGLKKEFLENAFLNLDTQDLVLAPSDDGGYSLIGLKKPCDELFKMEFSKDNVCENTVKTALNLGLKCEVLPRLQDIDTKEDIFKFIVKSDVKLLASGEYNANYIYEKDGVKRLFRVKFGSQIEVENPTLYEYNALLALQNCGVVPKVFKYYEKSEFLPYGAFEMEFLEGRALDYKKDLLIAPKLLAKVHNTKTQSNSSFLQIQKPFLAMYEECEKMAKAYFEYEKADKKILENLNYFFEKVQNLGLNDEVENSCIINTELNNTNFIINQNSYIIDWEKPVVGECEQDLAHFLAPTTTFFRTDTILQNDEILSFLKEYEKVRKFDIYKFSKYFKFSILRGLSWCAMAKVEYENQRNIGNVKEKIDSYFKDDFILHLKSIFENNCSQTPNLGI